MDNDYDDDDLFLYGDASNTLEKHDSTTLKVSLNDESLKSNEELSKEKDLLELDQSFDQENNNNLLTDTEFEDDRSVFYLDLIIGVEKTKLNEQIDSSSKKIYLANGTTEGTGMNLKTSLKEGKNNNTINNNNINVIVTDNYEFDPKLFIDDPNIFDIDLDNDNDVSDKPWRKPGADITDYFNYGFDEKSWRLYCLKQKKLREEYTKKKRETNSRSSRDRERDIDRESHSKKEKVGRSSKDNNRRSHHRSRSHRSSRKSQKKSRSRSTSPKRKRRDSRRSRNPSPSDKRKHKEKSRSKESKKKEKTKEGSSKTTTEKSSNSNNNNNSNARKRSRSSKKSSKK